METNDLARPRDEPIRFDILGGGRNWIQLTSYIALSLGCYEGFLPGGSTVTITAADPGSTCMDAPRLVAEGRYKVAITSPLWYAGMAVRGEAPFTTPLPLRALANIPHDDRLLFAVKSGLGIRSLDDIRDRRLPLRIVMPEPKLRHPATWMIDEVLKLHGFSIEDILSWGGSLVPTQRRRTRSSESGVGAEDYDAVFDEAVMTRRWHSLSARGDLDYLALKPEAVEKLARRGIGVFPLPEGKIAAAPRDLAAVDFSGWLLFCHENLPKKLAYDVVASLVEQGPAIQSSFSSPWAGLTGAIDPAVIAQTGPVPLHPGAERFYREAGAI